LGFQDFKEQHPPEMWWKRPAAALLSNRYPGAGAAVLRSPAAAAVKRSLLSRVAVAVSGGVDSTVVSSQRTSFGSLFGGTVTLCLSAVARCVW
jgi:asparagine synthetase B (glutamine-hydrolysing)